MCKGYVWVLLGVIALMGALGPAPRYVEELAIGGGFNSAPDGGADFEKNGAIATNGSVTANGVMPTLDQSADVGASTLRWRKIFAKDGDYSGAVVMQDNLTLKNGLKMDRSPAAYVDATSGPIVLRTQSTNASVRLTPNGSGKVQANYEGGTGGFEWFNGATTRVGFLDNTGNLTVDGGATVKGGNAVSGVAGAARGTLTLWQGGGGNAPAYIRLASPNGSTYYVFVADNGVLRIHSAVPSQNGDGQAVGTQF